MHTYLYLYQRKQRFAATARDARAARRPEAAHILNHRQGAPAELSQPEVSSWARRRETRTRQAGPRVRARPTGNLRDRCDAALSPGPRPRQVRSFKLSRSPGPPSKPKPGVHGPRSKSGVSSCPGQRTTWTLNSWGHMAGKQWEQAGAAGPKHVHAPAAEERPDRSTELEDPASGRRQVGVSPTRKATPAQLPR